MPRCLIPMTLVLTLMSIPSCGSSGGGDSSQDTGSSTAKVSLLIGDAPTDEFSSFSIQVDQASLRTTTGDTVDLLSAPRVINLIALQRNRALLEIKDLPPGTYEGARLVIDPNSIEARDPSGNPVAIQVDDSLDERFFAASKQMSAGQALKLLFQVDLDASIREESGTLRFSMRTKLEDRSSSDDSIDEVYGLVESVDSEARSMIVSLRDWDGSSSHGSLRIQLDDQTLLFDDDGGVYANEADFLADALGRRIEADGRLLDGDTMIASVIKIDDAQTPVHIKGTIAALDVAARTLSLRLEEISKGRAIVLPVLERLGQPAEIDIDFATAIILIEDRAPYRGTVDDLTIGQEIKAKFSTFENSPFVAQRIEIEDRRPEFEGTIVSDAGIPSNFIIHLEPHDPAVLSGRVDSSRTDVAVSLKGDEAIYLKLSHEPAVESGLLQERLRVRIRGTLSGPSSGPSLTADDIRVRPGRLDATVTSVDTPSRTFTIDVESIDDPFGGEGLGSRLTVLSLDQTRFEGDVQSEQEFFDTFLRLGGSDRLEVRLWGLRTPGNEDVSAYEVDVDIRD